MSGRSEAKFYQVDFKPVYNFRGQIRPQIFIIRKPIHGKHTNYFENTLINTDSKQKPLHDLKDFDMIKCTKENCNFELLVSFCKTFKRGGLSFEPYCSQEILSHICSAGQDYFYMKISTLAI